MLSDANGPVSMPSSTRARDRQTIVVESLDNEMIEDLLLMDPL